MRLVQPPSLRRSLLLVAALPLVVLVTSLGAISFWRKVQTFQPLGFQGHPEGAVWRVEAASRPSGLMDGDTILLVEGTEAGDRSALRARLQRQAFTRLLVQRGEELVEVEMPRPALDVDVPYLLLAAASIVYLLLGLYTLARQPRRETGLFFLWCLASSALGLLSPTLADRADWIGRAIYLVEQLARIVLPPLLLHLFLVFPRPAGERLPRAWRALVPFIYLPAAVLIALHVDLAAFGGAFLFGPATSERLALLDRLDLVHLGGFAVIAVATLLLRRRPDWQERRQSLWVAAGLAFGYGPFVLLYVLPSALGVREPSWLAAAVVVPLACVPVAFAWAILRYRLWDVGVIVRDAAAWTLTLLVGAVGFSLAQLAIRRGIPTELAEARNIFSFLAGIGIAATLVPARRTIGQSLERLHYRSAFGKRRSLIALGRELLFERNLDALCALLLSRLEEALELDRANIFVMQDGALVPARPEPEVPTQMAADALGLATWEEDVSPLAAPALPAPRLAPGERLHRAGYRYVFPLRVRGSRAGLVLLSHRAEGQPLSSEDVELVRGLLDQAALAIENAQLVDQLHRQLAETLRLRNYNQGVIESSPAGIAVLDGAGRVESANLAFAAIAGIERRELLGRRIEDVLAVSPLPAPGEGVTDASFCDLAGQERHLQVAVALLPEGGDGRVLIAQDVSERVAMENALKEKDRLASLGLLAAGVAHEVNTPITGISSYAQMLLADTAENDPRYELLKKVERQTFRASRIVNSLLDFARDRSAEVRPVSLSRVVSESADLLRERLAERRVTLEFADLEPSQDGMVLANEGELQQVFTNLMVNAIDAMAGGGRLRLALAGSEGSWTATVQDTGPGIPAALVDRVFQPFFSTKLGQGGTGLGLSISYQIVRRHGGEMRVENLAEGGCRFTVVLPRHGASSDAGRARSA